jgi:hypothetical protein
MQEPIVNPPPKPHFFVDDPDELEAMRCYRQALLESGEFDPYEINAMVMALPAYRRQQPSGWKPPFYRYTRARET